MLVVQAAPVTDAVLAAPPLRLICCARGGPVNVDVAAATERGIPVVTTPGKNADAVAELTIAFMVMLARRFPEAMRHAESGGGFGHDNYEGATGSVTTWPVIPWAWSASGRSAGGSRCARSRSGCASSPTTRSWTRSALEAPAWSRRSWTPCSPARDFVSLHARPPPTTAGCSARPSSRAMQPGAYFINTARQT